MKKLLFLILIVFVLSCKKESCYTCTITYITTTTGTGYASKAEVSSATVNRCDMSEEEIDKFINESTTTAKVTVSGVTATVRSTCACSKQ